MNYDLSTLNGLTDEELIQLIFIKILQISMFISVFLVFVHENAR